MQYFTGSYIFTAVGIILAYFWGEHVQHGAGLISIFIVLVLSVLEISLSFDNAVVNASKLAKMSKKWEKIFLTWGILIAVFGMRFLFPVLVVSVFSKLSLISVIKIALSNSHLYASYLHVTHAPIVTFGGMFLLMLFFSYFFNTKKELHWIKPIEHKMGYLGKIKGIETILSLTTLLILAHRFPVSEKSGILVSGLFGILIYLLIDGLAHWLETREESFTHSLSAVKDAGLIGFLYLELIDASFSLDGVLGAFALSHDIVIITIGLSIGAMFVRSMTVMIVEKKTLNKYIYLEHGAHWAIGALAFIMLITSFRPVPEVVTGLTGLVFILASFATSVRHNKKLNVTKS
jgi:hypothetical protein